MLQNPRDTRRIAFLLLPFQCDGVNPNAWFSDFFRLLGIENRVFYVTKPTQFAHVTLPEECVHTWHSYHKEYPLIYDTLAQNAQKECAGEEVFEKIYLAYNQWKWKNATCIGENAFERFFAERGFKIIIPEKLTIARQIHLIANAREIASTLGSVAHLTLFARPGTKQYNFTRDETSVLPTQIIISQAKGLDYTIVNTNANFLHAAVTGPVNLAFTPEFCEFARDVFGAELSADFGDFARYVSAWCEYYEKNFARIAALDAFDFLVRLARIFCGKTLQRGEFAQFLPQKPLPNSNLTNSATAIATALGVKLHFSGVGWVDGSEAFFDGRHLEAIRIAGAKCEQLVWDVWQTCGEMCGTTGRNRALRAFSLRLDGEFAAAYQIHDGSGWSRWFLNGERTSECERIRGIKIAFFPREFVKIGAKC